MVRNVLIVDDDQIWLRLIQKKFQKYHDDFHTLIAIDGLSAIQKLRENPISLVVTDLQMPEMDGLTLLAQLSESCPDIPVIIITAYSTPTYKRMVLERGAVGYIEKPFPVEDLARKILVTLKKETEGGTLQTVPLEIFIQLIEMEQKTCTLRITHKQSGKRGVLFFRDGDLLEARVKDSQGVKAAYQIFSWGEVSLSIEDACVLKEKRIEEDLQAILLDAMRLHDEDSSEEPPDEPSQDASYFSVDEVEDTDEEPELVNPNELTAEDDIPAFPADRSAVEEFSPITQLRDAILTKLGNPKELGEIYTDAQWAGFLSAVKELGNRLNAGSFKCCYIEKKEPPDLIIKANEPPLIVTLQPKTRRSQILDQL